MYNHYEIFLVDNVRSFLLDCDKRQDVISFTQNILISKEIKTFGTLDNTWISAFMTNEFLLNVRFLSNCSSCIVLIFIGIQQHKDTTMFLMILKSSIGVILSCSLQQLQSLPLSRRFHFTLLKRIIDEGKAASYFENAVVKTNLFSIIRNKEIFPYREMLEQLQLQILISSYRTSIQQYVTLIVYNLYNEKIYPAFPNKKCFSNPHFSSM